MTRTGNIAFPATEMAVDEMDIVCEDEVAGTLGFYEVKVHPDPQRTGGKTGRG